MIHLSRFGAIPAREVAPDLSSPWDRSVTMVLTLLYVLNATADALEWIIANEGLSSIEFIIHYLDNFLFGGSPDSDSCGRSLAYVQSARLSYNDRAQV